MADRERRFSMEDQRLFAKLSGDYNKLHIDEIAARRYMFGKPVVHGIHQLLWSLNGCFAEIGQRGRTLTSLRVTFRNRLLVGDAIKVQIKTLADNFVKLELSGSNRGLVATIDASWKSGHLAEDHWYLPKFPERREPKVLESAEVSVAAGELDLYAEEATLTHLFPDLVQGMPTTQIAELLATTQLVGMECPGFHSVYYELNVTFQETSSGSSALKYKTTQFDDRFKLVLMEVSGPTLQGFVKAVLRPKPQDQMAYADLATLVNADEFKGQKALVIGGSRGLGEISAKLLAAGGASVLLTYCQGREDADKITSDIQVGKGAVSSTYFDVLSPEQSDVDVIKKHSPTHLYYFATPHITANKRPFSPALFAEFCCYYVTGFSSSLNFLLDNQCPIKNIFYPSTIFIDQFPTSFAEYIAAKSAGESLCSYLEKNNPALSMFKPRLPKMATDQTVGVMIDEGRENPAPVILKQLRLFAKRAEPGAPSRQV